MIVTAIPKESIRKLQRLFESGQKSVQASNATWPLSKDSIIMHSGLLRKNNITALKYILSNLVWYLTLTTASQRARICVCVHWVLGNVIVQWYWAWF